MRTEIIKILYVEDLPQDEEMIKALLESEGFPAEITRVDTREGFILALEKGGYHLILSDYALPTFDGMTALDLARAMAPEVPFILTSGTLGEEQAIESLKRGATDYVLKQRIGRLIPAMERALKMADEQRDRRIAIEALKESEERYRKLIETARDVIFLVSPEGLLTSLNSAFEVITGWSRAEWIGHPFVNLVHPEDLKLAVERFQYSLAGVMSPAYELRIRMRSGKYAVAEITATPQFKNSKIVGIFGIARDITERKAFEDKLSQLSCAVEQSPNSILITDTHGRIEYVNPKFTSLTGYSEEEVLGQTPRILKSGETSDAEYKVLWDAITHGREWHGELHNKKKNGDLYWEAVSISAIKNARGEITHYLAIKEDVTERRRSEQALKESEEKYRSFFEEDLTGDYISTPAGRLVACNLPFARMFGYESVDEMLTIDMKTLYTDPKVRELLLQRLTREKRLEYIDKELVRKDGKTIYGIENMIGKFDDGGKLVEIRGYLFDDSKRRELEKQLIQAQKMESLGTLAGGIAHDFNNILGIILGHVSLIKRRATDPTYIEQNAETILKVTQRGAGLVRQLLTFARKTDVMLESILIHDIIQEINKFIEQTFPKVITITTQWEKDLPPIVADATQVHQVLLNLCVNARDAMPGGGKLTIDASRVRLEDLRDKFPKAVLPAYVKLSVTDTGSGMSEATKSRIFEPFFTTKGRDRGTGLGLATVYGIVEGHHGYIDVQTELDKGTTFDIYFPAQQSFIEQEIKKAGSPDIPGGTEMILVVDDEESMRDFLTEVLADKNYRVMTASDGQEALDLYATHYDRIDIVLTDMGLPKLGGDQLFIRMKQFNSNVKVIMASGYFERDQKSELYKAGVKDFVQKPYFPEEILRKIREVIDL